MTNYIPFLKTKTNEFACLKALEPEIAENITPFFDIHRKIEMYSEDEYIHIIDFVYKKINKNFSHDTHLLNAKQLTLSTNIQVAPQRCLNNAKLQHFLGTTKHFIGFFCW